MKADDVKIELMLGSETDQALKAALIKVINNLDCIILNRVESFDLSILEIKVDDRLLTVEAETYIGLTLIGARDLVERIADLVFKENGIATEA